MKKSGEGLKLYEDKMMKMAVEEEVLMDNLRPLHYLLPNPLIFSPPRSLPTLDDLFDKKADFLE